MITNNGIQSIERWSIFELELKGPESGNPFLDVTLEAKFTYKGRTLTSIGFYDGNGIYKIRFMPDTPGLWTFETCSSQNELNGISGDFICQEAEEANHGPVRVRNTFHFTYEDGIPYYPFGTTCYAWTHQPCSLQEETLKTLSESPFNKIRMCVFPKHYDFNHNEPELYPFEGSLDHGWDYERFNPDFFKHLENRIMDLMNLGIEADLILFHPYDRWGFAEMDSEVDDRYLKYVVARLSAFRNIWWSLANEYDIMKKSIKDWERFARIIVENDPYQHLRSIHNCVDFYDHSRPWITHCSIQRVDVYKTAELTTQWREQYGKPVVIDECAYEGNVSYGWGNITGEEMVRRFWEGTVRGGYVGHGETYVAPDEILWWSKGGTLHGSSPQRIAFLRKIVEEGPKQGMSPIPYDWDIQYGGAANDYYLFYFGFSQPAFRIFHMPAEAKYKVDIIDTWNMTVQELSESFQGEFKIDLPGRPYIAVRMIKIK